MTPSIDTLRAETTGTVLVPGDDGYDTARSLWNGAIDRRPAVVAMCRSQEDVVAALSYARENGLEIAVRGGGHSFSGASTVNDGVMINLSELTGVRVDPERRRAVVGGGATLADLDAATQEHGLAVTGGVVSHTGVAGLTLGGGMGWLTRKHGLSIDNLEAADVVLADGRCVRASATEHPELFWALRGGGGNFGVVTSFEFRLHPVGPMVNVALFFWAAKDGMAALQLCRDVVPTLPSDVSVLIGAGMNAPPLAVVPEQHHGAPGHALIVAGFGTPEEHAAAIAPIRRQLAPLFELVTPIPYVGLQALLDDSGPWGISAYDKAIELDDLTDDAIAVITEHAARKNSPMSFFPISRLDGTFSDVDDDATAFGGSRAPHYIVDIAAICPDPASLSAEREWARATWDALRPLARSSGSYVNFMGEYDEDRVRTSYGAKYERLARIKAVYDPGNLLHRNANIKPL